MQTPDRKDFPIPRVGATRRLNRMSEKRGDLEWVAARIADPHSRFLLFADLSLAVESGEDRNDTSIRWYAADELATLGADPATALLLGCGEDGHAIFAISLTAAQAAAAPGGYDGLKPVVDLRSLAQQGALSPDELSLAGMARALAAWHVTQRCCGRCGAKTNIREAGWRRRCWACGQEHFPRMDPAVIVLVTDGKHCLLGHHRRYAHKFYSTLAGFVEPGEGIEDCVRREMFEETGIRIGEVAYMATQPWPFPHSLMVGCWAEALSRDVILDEEELWDARWFSRDEVRQMMAEEHPECLTVPGSHSIAYALIRSFLEAR